MALAEFVTLIKSAAPTCKVGFNWFKSNQPPAFFFRKEKAMLPKRNQISGQTK